MKHEGDKDEKLKYKIGSTITFRLSKRKRISKEVLDFINNRDNEAAFCLNDEILNALELFVKFKKKGSTIDELLSDIIGKVNEVQGNGHDDGKELIQRSELKVINIKNKELEDIEIEKKTIDIPQNGLLKAFRSIGR